MIKKNRYLILGTFLIISALLYFLKKEKVTLSDLNSDKKIELRQKNEEVNLKGKKIIGLPENTDVNEIKKLRVANSESEDWKNNLHKFLLNQGQAGIKDIELKSIDSFIWANDGIALHVESVKVTLTNLNDEQTTFKVLVDSQSGKILKNWDRPVIDPVNPREGFRVRIDPRYHSQ